MLGAHKELAGKLTELENRVEAHDENITALFEAIRQLMHPPQNQGSASALQWRTAGSDEVFASETNSSDPAFRSIKHSNGSPDRLTKGAR